MNEFQFGFLVGFVLWIPLGVAIACGVKWLDKRKEILQWEKKHASLCGMTLEEFRSEFPLKGKSKI